MGYKQYLDNHYNMKSNITLEDYLGCMQSMSVVDIYSIDEETNEDYFGTLGKDDINDLDDAQKSYKVVHINNSNIVVYIEKRSVKR